MTWENDTGPPFCELTPDARALILPDARMLTTEEMARYLEKYPREERHPELGAGTSFGTGRGQVLVKRVNYWTHQESKDN